MTAAATGAISTVASDARARDARRRARLLRLYPAPWRARYGAELLVLMEDCAAEGRLGAVQQLAVAFGGLRERCHSAGLIGSQAGPADRRRVGAVVVLWAWWAFAVAGANVAKLAEHYRAALHGGDRTAASVPFDILGVVPIVGAVLLLAAGAIAVPAAAALVRREGWWPLVRIAVAPAVAGAVMVGATVALAGWAHHLSPAGRNGGDGLYTAAFLAWALGFAGTLALATRAASAAARRLAMGGRLLSGEVLLARLMAAVIVVGTLATATWWAVVASAAPWFLTGGSPGSAASGVDLRLLGSMAVMVLAVATAAWGVTRTIGDQPGPAAT